MGGQGLRLLMCAVSSETHPLQEKRLHEKLDSAVNASKSMRLPNRWYFYCSTFSVLAARFLHQQKALSRAVLSLCFCVQSETCKWLPMI